jgi:hypothetical protein
MAVTPAISTFSDHVVMSFSLDTMRGLQPGSGTPLNMVFYFAQRLVATIAAQAVRLGFLVRGGAAIGKSYHANGVVFGEALVEAVNLEAHTAVYPRVVLSPTVVHGMVSDQPAVSLEDDGIHCLDYIPQMMVYAARPGDHWQAEVKQWLEETIAVVGAALETHAREGRIKEFAKWTWFAKRFRKALEKSPARYSGVSIEAIPWGK